jgi:hypothetical protein
MRVLLVSLGVGLAFLIELEPGLVAVAHDDERSTFMAGAIEGLPVWHAGSLHIMASVRRQNVTFSCKS